MARKKRAKIERVRYRIVKPAFSPNYSMNLVLGKGRFAKVEFQDKEFETADPELIAHLDDYCRKPNPVFERARVRQPTKAGGECA